jgi:hypothetical protein
LAAWTSWIGAAFAVQWFVYLTDWGADGWLLPSPEVAIGMFSSTFGPEHRAGTWQGWVSALIWTPIAGSLWIGILFLAAPFFGATADRFRTLLSAMAAANIPLTILGVVVTAASWRLGWGYWWESSLWGARNGPWPWLGAAFIAAALFAAVTQIQIYWVRFNVRRMRLVYHLALSAALTLLATTGIAAIAAHFI